MTFSGNAPTEMRQVASICMQGVNGIRQLIQILERAIQILEASAWGNWVRPYIAMLKRVIAVMKQIVETLTGYNQTLLRNAEQQDTASGTPSSGTGAGRGSATPSKAFTDTSNALRDLANSAGQLLNQLNQPPAPSTATGADQPQLPTPQTGAEQPTPEQASPTEPDAVTPAGQVPVEPGGNGSGTGRSGGQQLAGGSGSLDSRPPETGAYGQTAVSRSPLGQGAIPAAFVEQQSGRLATNPISLGRGSTVLPSSVITATAAIVGGASVLAANRAADKAAGSEPNVTA